MWVLDVLDVSGGTKNALPLVEGTYTLGRKGASICFADDRSVSRKHAEIRVGPVPGKDPKKQPIFIKDVGSKFKTQVNGTDIAEPNVETPLKEGDVVRVGAVTSNVRLRQQVTCVCGTRLTPDVKKELRNLARRAGLTVARDWGPECTHLLTPSEASLATEKLVLALAEGRPAVQLDWLKTLVNGASAVPLRPAPDPANYSTSVKRGSKSYPIDTSNSNRRVHLEGVFIITLHMDAGLERIAEATGAKVCRAYEMRGDVFDRENWVNLSNGRRVFYVQPMASKVKLTESEESAVATRSAFLEGLGIEATTKGQVAEAILWLQPLLSIGEAESQLRDQTQASVAPPVLEASEAWVHPDSEVPSSTAPVAGSSLVPSKFPQVKHPQSSCSTKSASPPPKVAQTSVPVPPKVSNLPDPASVKVAMPGPRQDPEQTSGPVATSLALQQSLPTLSEPLTEVSRKRARGEEGNALEKGEVQETKVSTTKEAVCKGSGGGGRKQEGYVKVGLGGAMLVEGEGGDGARPLKRKRAGISLPSTSTDEDHDVPPRLSAQGRFVERIQADMATEPREDVDMATEPREDVDMATEPREDVDNPRRNPFSSAAAPNPSAIPPTSSLPPPQSLIELGTGGWISAHNALPAEKRSEGKGGVRKYGGDRTEAKGGMVGGKEDEGEEEEEEELKLLEPAVTMRMSLMAKGMSLSSSRGYSSSSYRQGGPNFKRFKKNLVMYGGEGVGDFVPITALQVTLPKESERELMLAAEHKRLEEEEADANRLFSEQGRVKAPRGRTKRR